MKWIPPIPVIGILLLLLFILIPASGISCSSGSEEEPSQKPRSEKKTRKKKPGKKPAAPKPAETESKAEATAGSPAEEAPRKPPDKAPPEPAPQRQFTLAWRIPEGAKAIFQVQFELVSKRKEKVRNKIRIDGTRFLRCTGVGEEGLRVVRLEPNPIEEIKEGQPALRRPTHAAEFMVLSPTGVRCSGMPPTRNTLLFGMADPVFPESEPAIGSGWTVERDFDEGRFVFDYRIEKETDLEGRKVLEIALTVEPPPGVPCETFRLEKGTARIWFDHEAGILQKAEGELAFTQGEGDEALATAGSFSVVFFNLAPMEPREVVEAGKAFKNYFAVVEMIGRKRYSGAERKIMEFEDETGVLVYMEPFYSLLKKIPDTRSLQPVGLLERKRFDFSKLPWDRERGPSIHGNRMSGRVEGKPRTLGIVGQALPEFRWKRLYAGGKWADVQNDLEGKVLLIHIWISWVPTSAETMKKIPELAGRFHGKGLRHLGITLDTENKKLQAFVKKFPLNHPTVWDKDNVAVKMFGLEGVPAFIVADRKGIIRFGEAGYFGDKTLERLERAIAECLK